MFSADPAVRLMLASSGLADADTLRTLCADTDTDVQMAAGRALALMGQPIDTTWTPPDDDADDDWAEPYNTGAAGDARTGAAGWDEPDIDLDTPVPAADVVAADEWM